ncbi:uncharacterized protein BXZ73DRAFT_76340 [Epithele typhae]|uniref:uncharacterized protein n=1 Tax=Epithele typhae TaxID=378194 RepID=UPI002007E44A|nr:uncharacterized protein BXZ73DRAFT_76340 [Epithele typhae]KAH9938837.1 hypothetical protein BXZ73DRAFT_76340 [Epithele typhae]
MHAHILITRLPSSRLDAVPPHPHATPYTVLLALVLLVLLQRLLNHNGLVVTVKVVLTTLSPVLALAVGLVVLAFDLQPFLPATGAVVGAGLGVLRLWLVKTSLRHHAARLSSWMAYAEADLLAFDAVAAGVLSALGRSARKEAAVARPELELAESNVAPVALAREGSALDAVIGGEATALREAEGGKFRAEVKSVVAMRTDRSLMDAVRGSMEMQDGRVVEMDELEAEYERAKAEVEGLHAWEARVQAAVGRIQDLVDERRQLWGSVTGMGMDRDSRLGSRMGATGLLFRDHRVAGRTLMAGSYAVNLLLHISTCEGVALRNDWESDLR